MKGFFIVRRPGVPPGPPAAARSRVAGAGRVAARVLLSAEKASVGGQAVIEGVMMRSPKLVSTAVRTPGGDISVRTTPYVSISKRNKILGLPIVRGAIVLIETLSLGISALAYSAEEALREDEGNAEDTQHTKDYEGGKVAKDTNNAKKSNGSTDGKDSRDSGTASDLKDRKDTRDGESAGGLQDSKHAAQGRDKKPGEAITKLSLTLTVIVAIVLGVGLFFYLPLLVAEVTGLKSGFWFNVVDGVVRLAIFILYVSLIGLWSEMRKLYQYHGAEHKSIHAFEAGEELTPDNAMKYTTLHPRCGTSFLLMVVIVSLVVFIALGRPESWAERGIRFLAIPLIAGAAFELTKLSGRYAKSPLGAALIAPGLWLQRITTKEPTREQVEVALRALKEVL